MTAVPDESQQREVSTIDLDHPFTRAELLAADVKVSVLRHDEFLQILPRVWIRKTAIDQDSTIRAALHLHPDDAFASHVSAAKVLGLPVPDHWFVHVTVFRPKDRRFRPQLKSHVTERRRRVITVRGIRVTDPIATFIDCAGWLSLVDLVVLGDAIVKMFDISPKRLLRACKQSTDYYKRRALAAAALVREGVDSPMETRLRLLIVLAGLPEPIVNYKVYNDDGTWRRRFDLCYPDLKLIIEYDGRQHAENVQQWTKDLERREEFDDEGYRILVVTAPGIYRDPLQTLLRVRRQLVLRGLPDVPELDDAWREHFPG